MNSHFWGTLDDWGHRLHIPNFIMTPVCYQWDKAIGVYDDEPEELTERKPRTFREYSDERGRDLRTEEMWAAYYQAHKDELGDEWGDPE